MVSADPFTSTCRWAWLRLSGLPTAAPSRRYGETGEACARGHEGRCNRHTVEPALFDIGVECERQEGHGVGPGPDPQGPLDPPGKIRHSRAGHGCQATEGDQVEMPLTNPRS